jgi:hypothetical protein
MRWKRLPRPLSTSAPVNFLASATSSTLISEPIKVAISPTLAARTSGKSVMSIGNRSREGRPTTEQRCPPTRAYSLALGEDGLGNPSACPTDKNAIRRVFPNLRPLSETSSRTCTMRALTSTTGSIGLAEPVMGLIPKSAEPARTRSKWQLGLRRMAGELASDVGMHW